MWYHDRFHTPFDLPNPKELDEDDRVSYKTSSDLRKFHFPAWASAFIAMVLLILSCITCVCAVRKCSRRRRKTQRSSNMRKSMVSLCDTTSLGHTHRGRVQLDVEDVDAGLMPMNGQEEYSNEEEEEETKKESSLGKLQYSIEYDFHTSKLIVGVVKGEKLLAVDINGTSDPYIKICLIPKGGKKFQTRVHRKTLNPDFNEYFTFKVSYGELAKQTIVLSVFDFDRFSHHTFIGEVRLPIASLDLGSTVEEWQEIQPGIEDMSDVLGDLCFSLRYIPTAGKLFIVILEGKNLKNLDKQGISDPYVKLQLVQNRRKLKKKKTTVKMNTLNPYFNETFSFDIPFDQIQNTQIIFSIYDANKVKKNEAIGSVVVGCNASANGIRHWSDMLANPRRPVVQWHALEN
uniref:Synaptotagmin 5 n=1 Tax=Eptatretus burgeri TaxID=7764 RepID=A0A8C4NAM9_EPTBU